MKVSRTYYSLCIIMLLFIVCSFSSSCSLNAEAREEFHKTYTVDSGTPVSVKNVNGSIRVSAWEKDYVDVYAVKKSRHGQDDLDKVKIEVYTNGELRIETERLERRDHVSVEYTLKVPKNVPVKSLQSTNGSIQLTGTTGDSYILTTNGSLQVEDTDGCIEAQTTNGQIRIDSAAGISKVRSTNGNIDVSFSKFTDDVDISTTNGSVRLTIPENIHADIDMRTTNGQIKGNDLLMTVDEISKKRLKGRIGSGGNALNVRTTNGGITIDSL
ncbi:MAG: DUF4097 family beta strand repeat protein [Candidatus Latescibacteria bacterium]|nr:DUF4097 family beta strand repeat protein [Candidatus Latescibacterota bacterium]